MVVAAVLLDMLVDEDVLTRIDETFEARRTSFVTFIVTPL